MKKKKVSAKMIGGILAILAIVAIALAAGCSGGGGTTAGSGENAAEQESTEAMENVEETEVHVVVNEWSVKAEPATVAAGKVEFIVSNEGKETHELVVAKDGKVMNEIEDLKAGTTGEMEIDLEPGNYELFCEIVETEPSGEKEDHKALGMLTDFTVQ